MGLDRVLIAMDSEDVPMPSHRGPHVFVVAIGGGARDARASLVRELRDAGIATASALEERPLNAQLRMADRAGAAYAAIIGEQEVRAGTVTLRDMSEGGQEEVPRDDVVNWLSRTDLAAER
jgi:histidyl-tRNA synthetase